MWLAPWMSWIRRPATLESVVKLVLESALGWLPSASVTASASTVSVQRASRGSCSAGSSVKVVPSPLTDSGTSAPLQASANASSPAVTGSLKVTVMFASRSTSSAPLAGSVEATDGSSPPQEAPLAAPGVLGATTKSVPFWFVSHPSGTREMLWVPTPESAGAPAVPSV